MSRERPPPIIISSSLIFFLGRPRPKKLFMPLSTVIPISELMTWGTTTAPAKAKSHANLALAMAYLAVHGLRERGKVSLKGRGVQYRRKNKEK